VQAEWKTKFYYDFPKAQPGNADAKKIFVLFVFLVFKPQILSGLA
jgi:hypothetical protein